MRAAVGVFLLTVLPHIIIGQRSSFDYDYAEEPASVGASSRQSFVNAAPSRPAQPASFGPSASLAAKDTTTRAPQVEILQQIDEHNEDGSYTYGYEGSDGSFKLETRFPDGRVQGRYGYIDIETGKLKVIEYGADFMGFQPVGDLPEGIVVPPPVFNNDTIEGEENYDDNGQFEENPRLTVQTRARQGSQQAFAVGPSQNRGQDFQQPSTNREVPSQAQQFAEASFGEPRPQLASRFEPTGAVPAQRPVQAPQPTPALPRPAEQPQQPFTAFQSSPQFQPTPRPPQQQFQAAPAVGVQQSQQFAALQGSRQAVQSGQFEQAIPQPPFQPLPAQGPNSFTEEINFEGRPTATQLFATSGQNPAPQPFEQQPREGHQFQNLVSEPAQSRFQPVPAAPLGPPQAIPEAVRSSPVAEEDVAQPTEPFNPNRARGSVGRQQSGTQVSRPISAAPVRPVARPAQPEQFAQQPQPALPQQQQPVRLQPQRPAPQAQTAVPSLPATPVQRPQLSRGQHITQSQSFDNEATPIEAQHHVPGSQPKFESFPIVESGGAPRRPLAQVSQPAPQPNFQQQVIRESFRPEEEPAQPPAPLKIQPQFEVDTDFQSIEQQQQPQQLQIQDQFQQQQQHLQPQQQQPLRHGPFQQHQFQSSVNFDNLVKEFSAQSRAGRSQGGFITRPFKFKPVPAVPDL